MEHLQESRVIDLANRGSGQKQISSNHFSSMIFPARNFIHRDFPLHPPIKPEGKPMGNQHSVVCGSWLPQVAALVAGWDFQKDGFVRLEHTCNVM